MEQQFDVWRYVAVLRRRWLYLVLPAIVIAVASVAFAYTTAPVYEASATILVESQQIPTDLASPTVTSDAAERVRVIEQRLLTRDNLLEVARKYSLYQYLGTGLSPTTIVENVRRAVRIQQIDTIGGSNRVVGFTVKFQYRDGATAARVTTDLVTSILSQNVESRLSRASETSEFFAQQKNTLQQRLLELEHRMAEFKRANEADLPETLDMRRDRYVQTQREIDAIDQKIRLASDPTSTGLPPGAAAGIKQLNFSLQAKELELNSVKLQREELIPLAEKGFVPSNRMRDIDRQIALAELDIEALKAQIADRRGLDDEGGIAVLQDQRAELLAQATALSESIQRTPLIQVELNAMDRDYDNLQNEFRQAQTKLEDAQVGERLEQDRQSERFEVIEQASVPDQPTSPDRPRIMMAGLASGFAAGAGLVILRQLLDRAVYTAADIERGLQLRPIAVVPYVKTAREKRRARRRMLLLIVFAVAVLVAGVLAVHFFYQPLDMIAQRQFERIYAWLSARGMFR